MTVPAKASVAVFVEDGVTLVFPVAFPFRDRGDIQVHRRLPGGDWTAVTPSAVTGGGEGGTVTLAATVAGGRLRIRRRTARTQGVSYTTRGDFPATSHEGALDRLTLIAQEQDDALDEMRGRALLVPVGAVAPAFPDPATLAGKALSLTPDGTVVGVSIGDGNDPGLRDDLAGAGGAGHVAFRPGPTAVTRTVAGKLAETLSAADFGAVGDGVADDGAAIRAAIAAAAPGARIRIPAGRYRLTRSLVLDKPVILEGGTKEQVVLIFDAGGVYAPLGETGQFAGILVLHAITAGGGDARRTVISGLTIEGAGAPNCHGIVLAAPATLSEVDSVGHALSGMAVMAEVVAAGSAPIRGNANGCMFYGCISRSNGNGGFYLVGNDANACTFMGCRAPDNGEYGFYDNSLLGNSYVGCEADANGIAGYWTNPLKPIRSTFVGCYSETPGHFQLGPLCILIGSQGLYKPRRAGGGVGLHGLPSGDAYLTQALTFADTDDIANGAGEAPNAGAFMRIGSSGIDYNPDSDGPHIRLNNTLNPNDYVDLMIGAAPVLRLPARRVAGNVDPSRAHMPMGFTMGASGKSGIVGSGAAPPAAGTYAQGAIWLNDSPAASGNWGWICVAGGVPGTWKALGGVAA